MESNGIPFVFRPYGVSWHSGYVVLHVGRSAGPSHPAGMPRGDFQRSGLPETHCETTELSPPPGQGQAVAGSGPVNWSLFRLVDRRRSEAWPGEAAGTELHRAVHQLVRNRRRRRRRLTEVQSTVPGGFRHQSRRRRHCLHGGRTSASAPAAALPVPHRRRASRRPISNSFPRWVGCDISLPMLIRDVRLAVPVPTRWLRPSRRIRR